jgi:DNA-binding response OmpR family regulator
MKILVCDDDEALVNMIRFKLTRENLGEIIKALDGREAKTLLRESDFDLVITDIYMPFYSGLEVVTFLREELKKIHPLL